MQVSISFQLSAYPKTDSYADLLTVRYSASQRGPTTSMIARLRSYRCFKSETVSASFGGAG